MGVGMPHLWNIHKQHISYGYVVKFVAKGCNKCSKSDYSLIQIPSFCQNACECRRKIVTLRTELCVCAGIRDACIQELHLV